MSSILGIKLRRAFMFDEKGEHISTIGFSKKAETFKYGKGSYNVDIKNASRITLPGFLHLWEKEIYYYNIANPNPLVFDKRGQPLLSPELYNIQLETKIARDLNDLSKTGLSELLTPRNIIIGLIILGAIYYFATGGKVFGVGVH